MGVGRTDPAFIIRGETNEQSGGNLDHFWIIRIRKMLESPIQIRNRT